MSDSEDARRYRWLMRQAFVVDHDGGWASRWVIPNLTHHNDSPNKAFAVKRRSLSEAIDAEMEKSTTTEPRF